MRNSRGAGSGGLRVTEDAQDSTILQVIKYLASICSMQFFRVSGVSRTEISSTPEHLEYRLPEILCISESPEYRQSELSGVSKNFGYHLPEIPFTTG